MNHTLDNFIIEMDIFHNEISNRLDACFFNDQRVSFIDERTGKRERW